MIHVLIAVNDSRFDTMQLSRITSRIPKHMVEQASKYGRWQDFQACLLGKFLLAEGLQKYRIDKDILYEMKYTAHNKPYLDAGIDFNISHSGKYVVCVISKEFSVGIDIEEIRDTDISDFTDQFTDQEMWNINHAEDKFREFFKYWTIKEAVIKADGRGLSVPLKNILVTRHVEVEGNRWYFYEIDVDKCYLSHIATDGLTLPDNIIIERIPKT